MFNKEVYDGYIKLYRLTCNNYVGGYCRLEIQNFVKCQWNDSKCIKFMNTDNNGKQNFINISNLFKLAIRKDKINKLLNNENTD